MDDGKTENHDNLKKAVTVSMARERCLVNIVNFDCGQVQTNSDRYGKSEGSRDHYQKPGEAVSNLVPRLEQFTVLLRGISIKFPNTVKFIWCHDFTSSSKGETPSKEGKKSLTEQSK